MMLTLTRQQYHTLRRVLDTLPGQVRVYPTHGASSFCLSTGSDSARSTTIAQERLVNPAAVAKDEDEFIQRQMAGYSEYPTYYRYMGPTNKEGPTVLGALSTPPPFSPQEVQERMQGGMPLFDGRRSEEWREGHIPGALHIHVGDLAQRMHELPKQPPIMTICRSGHRAQIAASMIVATGREVIAVRDGMGVAEARMAFQHWHGWVRLVSGAAGSSARASIVGSKGTVQHVSLKSARPAPEPTGMACSRPQVSGSIMGVLKEVPTQFEKE